MSSVGKSKEEILEYLRRRKKRMILGGVIAFLLCYLLLITVFGGATLGAAIKSIIYATGVLIAYYFIIAKPSKLQRIWFKVVIIGGTASWFSIASLFGLVKLGIISISPENRMFAIGMFAICFAIGAYIGTLMLKCTRLRWWVET